MKGWQLGGSHSSGSSELPPALGLGCQASSCYTLRDQRESGWHSGAQGEMLYPVRTAAAGCASNCSRASWVMRMRTLNPHPRLTKSFMGQFRGFSPTWASALSWLFKLNQNCHFCQPFSPIPTFPFHPRFWISVRYVAPPQLCQSINIFLFSYHHVPLSIHAHCYLPS